MTDVAEYQVVIVGAGPAGLALAIELGSRGVRCLLAERNDRVGYAPRAKTTNVRTRTHLRRWGIADRLAEASPFGVDYPSNVVFVTRLAGPELTRIGNAFNAAPAHDPRYPEHGQWIPQYKLEQVLRAHVATLDSVDVRFNTELLGMEQTDAGVRVALRDLAGDGPFTVGAAFLVGADGARSRVRDVIGATMSGAYGLSHNYNIIFRAPGLAAAHRHGPAIMYWQVNGDVPSLIGPMDRDDVWFFMPTGVPEDTRLSDDEARALIARSTGIDLPYEILSSDRWAASRLLADKYREGRVFLVGDACHLHPPFGGYGMNMGVADGVDLGWKLAAVLQGWGGDALLDSYAAERRPVHQFVMDEAEANHAVVANQLWAPGLDDDTAEGADMRRDAGGRIRAAKTREFHTLGAVLGSCYADSPAVVGEDGGGKRGAATDDATADAGTYDPSSRPGCLAPHAWLSDTVSLYDLFGPGFTLLARGEDEDTRAAARQAEGLGIPLAVVVLPVEVSRALYPAPLTLVRPDQHVCWRGATWRADVLPRVTGRRPA